MLQPHQLHIAVGAGGKVDIQVTYKDHVPKLLSGFSRAVRWRAALGLAFPSAHEWKVLQACHGMPRWAQDTVRQHLMYERAVRIDANMKRNAERQRARAERRAARALARQQKREQRLRKPVQEWGPVIGTAEPSPALEIVPTPTGSVRAEAYAQHPEVTLTEPREAPTVTMRAEMAVPAVARPTAALPRIGGPRQNGGSALGAPLPQRPSLTARLAELHGIEHVHPDPSRNVRSAGRGR